MIQPFLVFSGWAILFLRVVVGIILVAHGLPKLKNLQKTVQGFEGMGFKPGIFWGTLVGVLEFVGGIALMLGLFTQVIAVLVVIQFMVILLKVKRGAPLVGGYEFDLLILAAAVALATLGSGFVSLERLFSIVVY